MKDKKNVVIGLLCVAVCIMAVGYAAFQTVLNINGTASITSTWNVEIINIVPNKTTTNTGTEQAPVYTTTGDISHSYTGTTANFSAALISPGDSVVYTVTVKNKGTIPAIVNDIVGTELGSDAIEFSIAGIAKGDTLAVNAEDTFTVTVTYKSSVTGQPANTASDFTMTLNYVQDLGQTINPSVVMSLHDAIMGVYTPVSDASIDFSYTSEGYNGSEIVEVCLYNGEEVWLGNLQTQAVNSVQSAEDCEISNVCLLPGAVVDQLTGTSDNPSAYIVADGLDSTTCSQYGGTLYGEAWWAGRHINAGYNASQVTNGLYYTSDLTKTEGGETVYYFRGNVNNNYVKLGNRGACHYNGVELDYYDYDHDDMHRITTQQECESVAVCYVDDSTNYYYFVDDQAGCDAIGTGDGVPVQFINNGVTWDTDILWRVVRINEDGSIRMVMQDSVGYASFDDTYPYTNINYIGSPVESALNTFYTSSLQAYNSLIADAGFCNDTSIGSVTGAETYYGAFGRLYNNKTPQYKCAVPKLTLNNGLTKKIGLLSADEIVYAGEIYNYNSTYYLASQDMFWSMSPWYLDNDHGDSSYATIFATGEIGDIGVDNGDALRPVINLVSNIEVASGNGTQASPWVIKTN